MPLSFFFLVTFLVWVVWQTGKNVWNLLRLFPIAWFILFLFVQSSLPEWQQVVWLLICVATLAESGGVMLTPRKSWIEEECGGSQLNELERLVFTVVVGLPALFVTVGMVLVCIADAVWLVGIWELFPLISLHAPYMPIELVVALGVMVLVSLIALLALVRGTLAFRSVPAAVPRQEPLQHAHN